MMRKGGEEEEAEELGRGGGRSERTNERVSEVACGRAPQRRLPVAGYEISGSEIRRREGGPEPHSKHWQRRQRRGAAAREQQATQQQPQFRVG